MAGGGQTESLALLHSECIKLYRSVPDRLFNIFVKSVKWKNPIGKSTIFRHDFGTLNTRL